MVMRMAVKLANGARSDDFECHKMPFCYWLVNDNDDSLSFCTLQINYIVAFHTVKLQFGSLL